MAFRARGRPPASFSIIGWSPSTSGGCSALPCTVTRGAVERRVDEIRRDPPRRIPPSRMRGRSRRIGNSESPRPPDTPRGSWRRDPSRAGGRRRAARGTPPDHGARVRRRSTRPTRRFASVIGLGSSEPRAICATGRDRAPRDWYAIEVSEQAYGCARVDALLHCALAALPVGMARLGGRGAPYHAPARLGATAALEQIFEILPRLGGDLPEDDGRPIGIR